MGSIVWWYLRKRRLKKDGREYDGGGELRGEGKDMGVRIKGDMVKEKVGWNKGGLKGMGLGKRKECMYWEVRSEDGIEVCGYEVGNGYMGGVGLIKWGGEWDGEWEVDDGVVGLKESEGVEGEGGVGDDGKDWRRRRRKRDK